VPIIGWGLAPSIVDIGLDYIDPLPFLTYRFLAATLLLTPFILLKKQEEVKLLLKNRWTWIIGLSQAWAILFQYLSQLFILPSLSATISYSYMILVPLVSVIILQESLDRRHIPVVVIATLGLAMITTEGNLDIFNTSGLGIFLAFLATWGFAFYITSTSRLTTKESVEVDSFALFYIIMVIVSITGLLLSLIFQADMRVASSTVWISILLLTLISTVFAYIAYIEALKFISANTASVVLLLQIVLPFLIDFFVFGRTFSWWVIVGSLLIIAASALAIVVHHH